MGEEDLSVLISLIFNFDEAVESGRYAEFIDRVARNSASQVDKAGKKIADGFDSAVAEGFNKGGKAVKATEKNTKAVVDAQLKGIRRLSDAEAKALSASIGLISKHVSERISVYERQQKAILREAAKAHSIELEELRKSHREALAADAVANREKLAKTTARLRDESELLKLSIRGTERNQKALNDAKAKRDRQVQAKQKAADQAAEFDRRKDRSAADKLIDRSDREAAQDRARIAREGAAARARAETLGNKTVLQAQRANTAQSIAETRKEAAQKLQAQRAGDNLALNAEQASEARKTAFRRTTLRLATSTYESGLRATQSVISSFLRKRENAEKNSGDKITNIYQGSAGKQTSEIRQQLDRQNAEYSRAATQRLAIIESAQTKQTSVITAGAVRQAEAQAAIQSRANTGVIGAATGRGKTGNFLQNTLIGGGVVLAIKSLVTAASSLNESQSKVAVVFGQSAAAVSKFASTAANALGISRQAALEATGTYGNLFQSFGVGRKKSTEMSIGLVKLASDLASFNNTSVGDAIEALRSGLTGETEPLKRYGIAINDVTLKQKALDLGLLKSSTSTADMTQKRIALEKAQKAVAKSVLKYGETSLEARSATNRLEIATANLGKTMKGKLPAQLSSAVKAQAAYALILDRSRLAQGDFARTSDQFANTSRITTARLLDLKAALGTGLLPIALGVATAFNKVILPVLEKSTEFISNLIAKIATGKGAYKVVRDGLLGIAIAGGALLALKGAAEAVGLLATAVKFLATVAVANPAIASLVVLAAVASALYRGVPAVRSFFDSLFRGTRDWIKVAQAIDRPITSLSNIIAIQSGLGIAARRLVDSFGYMKKAIGDFAAVVRRDGVSGALSNLKDKIIFIVQGLGRGLGGAFGPVKTKLIEGFRETFSDVAAWVADRAPEIFKSKINTGSFLLKALGLGGTGGGIVSTLLRKAISKVFLDSVDPRVLSQVFTAGIGSLSTAEGATAAGDKLNKIFHDGVARVKADGLNVGRFFQSLFSGNLGESGSTASLIGIRVRATIEKGLGKVGDLSDAVGRVLGNAGAAIGGLFTRFVLPKLIELPRILGRTISRTAFSETFLKTVLAVGAGIAAVAIVIAGQFIRGFIEGIVQRRGDIAKVVSDVIGIAFGGIAKTLGTPIAVLTGVIVSAFIGSKVLGAISTLRGLGKVAIGGLSRGFKGAQEAAGALHAETQKLSGVGAKVGNAAIGLRKGYELASGALGKALDGAAAVSRAAFRAGGQVGKIADRVPGIGKAFRDLPASLSLAFEKLPAPAQRVFSKIADGAKTAAGKVTSVFQAGAARVKDALSQPEAGARALQGTVLVATSAISGYFAGMAKGAEAKALSTVAAVGSIATAFTTQGPIVGSISAAATAIGSVYGAAQRKSKEAKAAILADAAETKRVAGELTGEFKTAFKDIGSTEGAAKGAASLQVFRDEIDKNSKGIGEFRDKFLGSFSAASAAASKGKAALKDYLQGLKNTQIEQIFAGNEGAIKRFRTEVKAAGVEVADFTGLGFSLNQRLRREADKGGTSPALSKFKEVTKALREGTIGFDDYIAKLKTLGATDKEIAEITATFAASLDKSLSSSAGGKILDTLVTSLVEGARQAKLFAEANAEALSVSELTGPIATRFATAYGKIKDAIDRATTAYGLFVDAQNGKKVTIAQARVDLRSNAKDFNTAVDGETPAEAADRRILALTSAQTRVSDVVGRLASESGGDINVLKSKLGDFFKNLKDGNPELGGFIDQLAILTTTDTGALTNALGTEDAVKSVEGVKTKLRELFAIPAGQKLKIELDKATSFDEKRRIIIADLHSMEQDPTVKAFLAKDDNFQATLDSILGTADFIGKVKPKIQVGFVFEDIGKKAANFLGLAGATRGVLPTLGADGGLFTKPTNKIIGEAGAEVLLPLTNPKRMAELLGLPQVRKALGALPASGSLSGASSAYGVSTTSNTSSHRVETNVPITIIEAQRPRQTAMEVMSQAKAASFRAGATVPGALV